MTSSTRSIQLRADVLVAVGVALVAAVAMWLTATPSHGWGDDFAGYLMQARAIGHGTLRQELELGTRSLLLSDSKFGPPAYPWGYPAMLWLATHAVGWEIVDLKVVAVFANGLLAACMYLLGRRYVSRASSLVITAFVSLQPTVLLSGDSLVSDVPSLALNVAALLAMDGLAQSSGPLDRPRYRRVLAAAVLTALAFATRSNGAFLAVAMFSALAWRFLFADRTRRRVLATEMAALTAATTVLFLASLKGLPDGSLVHAGYLSLAPKELLRRLVETVSSTADIVPLTMLRTMGIFSPAVVAVTGALAVAVCAIGAWAHRDRSVGLVVFGILNFFLLLTFPDNGGPRYLFPLLLPFGVLFAAGADAIARRPRAATTTAVRLNVHIGLASAVMVVGLWLTMRGGNRIPISGPFTPASDSLFVFIRQHVPRDATVSFFKPRALRWFTDRMGVAITQPENLGRVDVVILDKLESDGRWEKTWQVDEHAIATVASKRFVKEYENSQFLVYAAGK